MVWPNISADASLFVSGIGCKFGKSEGCFGVVFATEQAQVMLYLH